ncbi:MAG: conjugative transposon protein TraM [Bacteroidales bacterium]|nr:conjugative transposon protein TraM [Bacteroidales bacterium]
MENKRNIIIVAIIALVVFTAILLLSNMPDRKVPEVESVKVTLPDAQVQSLPRAKIKAYGEKDKKESYDKFLSEMASSQQMKDSAMSEAMHRHTQAAERLSRRMQSKCDEGYDNIRAQVSSSSSHSKSYTAANKDNWQERYDYLYDKLYGSSELNSVSSKEEAPQLKESLPVPTNEKQDEGFITITVGKSAQELGVVQAATTAEQKIKAGDKVQLRLLSDAQIQNRTIARNTYLYAIAKIEDNRLQLTVSNISLPSGAIQCYLSAYDTDGYKGLSFSNDDTVEQVNREVRNAIQTTVGQLAAITNRTAGNIIRSTSRIGSNAIGNNRQQTITLPANYMIQLR